MIADVKDILPKVVNAYEKGWGKVYNLGVKPLSQYYNIVEGSCTEWTGYPQSGKTEFLMECLINCSSWYNHRYTLYMPDAGSITELVAKIAHKLTGKSFEVFYYNKDGQKVLIEDRMTIKEVVDLVPQIFERFDFFDPRDEKGKRKIITPLEFFNYVADNKADRDLFGGVIDSWNYLKHDVNELGFSREDKWLEFVLSQRNTIAEENGLHFHTIIHPKSEKKNKEGQVVMPDMHSLKGGSEWGNNGKSIIVVHREFASPITDIKISKAKPKRVGKQGMIAMNFDVKKSRYYYQSEDFLKKYAERPTEESVKVSEINSTFDEKTPF